MYPLRLLAELPGLSLYHDAEADWLYADWHGPQTAASVRLGCQRVLLYLRALRCHKILNDNSSAVGDWNEAGKWLGEYFLPQAKARGLRYVACVYAPGVPGRSSTLRALEYYKQEFPWVGTFDDLATAHGWLQNCPKPAPVVVAG